MSAHTRTFAMIACLLAGAACDEEGIVESRKVTTVDPAIAIEPANVDLAVGGTAQLIVHLTGGRGILFSGLSWTSSDPEVATVSLVGLVTARGEGFAVITAKSGSQSGFARVNVSAASQGQDLPLGKRPIKPF
jgi:uncharacterized protein YjdB